MWTGGEEAPWTESQSPPPAPAATPASADGRGKLQGVLRRRGELGPVPPSRLRPELWGAPKRGRKGSPSPSSGAALRAIGCPDGRCVCRFALTVSGKGVWMLFSGPFLGKLQRGPVGRRVSRTFRLCVSVPLRFKYVCVRGFSLAKEAQLHYLRPPPLQFGCLF